MRDETHTRERTHLWLCKMYPRRRYQLKPNWTAMSDRYELNRLGRDTQKQKHSGPWYLLRSLLLGGRQRTRKMNAEIQELYGAEVVRRWLFLRQARGFQSPLFMLFDVRCRAQGAHGPIIT